jgi:hypothetical protein
MPGWDTLAVVVGSAAGALIGLLFVSVSIKTMVELLQYLDDEEREFAYTAGAETSLEQAKAQNWTVVSIKDDWATVFADA